MHPLFRLLATQPQLLVDHLEAYVSLIAAEIGQRATVWKRQVLLNALALCSLGVTAVLAGVALMLWAVIPAHEIQAPWALIVVPLLTAVVAIGSFVAAEYKSEISGFDKLQQQMKADMAILREAGADAAGTI